MTDKKDIESKSPIESKFNIASWDDIDDLILQLAQICIKDNSYRKGNEFRNFTEEELNIINKAHIGDRKDKLEIEGGYMFLDDPNGRSGLVKIFSGNADPGWGFEMDATGRIEIDYS